MSASLTCLKNTPAPLPKADAMRVLDFDNTIYSGESVLDLYLFALRYEPKTIRFIAPVLRYAALYKLGRMPLERLEAGLRRYAHEYLCSFSQPERLVEDFWRGHMKKLKKWYSPRADDVIITASFDVVMEPVCRRLGTSCISSVINRQSLEVEYLNFGANKPSRFHQIYPGVKIDEFYTDNISDRPMIDAAERAYLVRGERITRIK